LEPKLRNIYDKFLNKEVEDNGHEHFDNESDDDKKCNNYRLLQKFAILALGKTNVIEKNRIHNYILKSAR